MLGILLTPYSIHKYQLLISVETKFGMMKKLFLLLFFSITYQLKAQTDSTYTRDYIDKSTKFAWLTLGIEGFKEPGGKTSFLQNGVLQTADFNGAFTPRLTIGGIHFWGHADFYVTFPLTFASVRNNPSDFETLKFRQGVETGARFYPLKLQEGRVSPFVGISFNTFTFSQEQSDLDIEEGTPNHRQVVAPLEAGLTYTSKKFHIMASAYFNSINSFSYALTPEVYTPVEINPMSFSLKLYRYIDTDRHYRKDNVLQQLNTMYSILEKEGKLSAWYWGIGPSAGIQMSKSSFIKNNHPYLNNDRFGGFMPDISFGRFFAKPDMNIGISYRTMGDQLTAFDTKLQMRRHSFMLEAYKNIFNYLGFVPYVGITASAENLRADINGVEYEETKAALGIIAGWDIRVTKTGTSLLRTNLRWSPNLHLDIEGDKMMFDHLEFNFIQYVHFIGRGKTYEKYRK